MTTWESTLENVSVSFATRVGPGCRFVWVGDIGDGMEDYAADFDASRWDEMLGIIDFNLDIFRRNLAQAIHNS